MIFVLTILLILKLSFTVGEDSPTVTIPDGELVGTVGQTIGDNTTYYAFKGIPYAQKPVGNLRFANPVTNDAWTGTLNATEDKDACTQLPSSFTEGTDDDIIGSEDCLYISVYTTNYLTGSLPVMVWFYGGGFTKGSSAYDWYGPDYLIDQGILYVSFNYRLGVFGFLSTGNSAAYGNWGLKDQILALQWIQDNIAYFGGNPNNVTIFGQSAGAACVSYLVQSSLTTGLFQRAIMESGTSLNPWTLARNANTKAFKIGTVLGIVALTSSSLITQLRAVDYKELKLAESNVTLAAILADNILAGLPFAVVAEPAHSGAVFTGNSYELLEAGDLQNVDLIMGYNSNELGILEDYMTYVKVILAKYDADNALLAPKDLTTNVLKNALAGVSIKNNYFGLALVDSAAADIVSFLSNDQFDRAIREYSVLTSGFVNSYLYKFDYKGNLGFPNATYAGVGHAEDLNYLFVSSNDASDEDIATRTKMVKLWTNFVKYGNPTPDSNDSTLDGVTWEPNTSTDDVSTTIKYLYINDTLSLETNPEEEDWEFYLDIYDTYGDASYSTY